MAGSIEVMMVCNWVDLITEKELDNIKEILVVPYTQSGDPKQDHWRMARFGGFKQDENIMIYQNYGICQTLLLFQDR